MSETIEIEDVKRLNVQPGEVLLVTVPRGMTREQAEDIKNRFETHLPVRVIVKTSEIQVEAAGPERVR